MNHSAFLPDFAQNNGFIRIIWEIGVKNMNLVALRYHTNLTYALHLRTHLY